MDDIMTSGNGDESQDIINNKTINEEYKIWKKNAVFLYDIMYSRALDWPTLTCQWFPDVQSIPDRNFSTHRILLGTHTSGPHPPGGPQEYLQIAKINYPTKPPSSTEYDAEKEELGGHGASKQRIEFSIDHKILHPGEVNKARYQWQNPDIIATMAPDGRALIFDRSKHPNTPSDNTVRPQVELKGHTQEGFGLNWNKCKEGELATGSRDNTVRVWDIEANFSKDCRSITTSRVLSHHSSEVNDVQFHPKNGCYLGSVSDDKDFRLADLRDPDRRPLVVGSHSDAINSLAFHPTQEMIVATASADKTVGIHDLRYGRVHTLEGHHDMVTKVEWSPHDSAILASGADDRRIIMWDLSRAGMEQTPDDAEDGPPEMLMMHGGQTSRVSDFSWNPNDPWVICSVAEDNLLQAWRPARSLVETLPAGITVKDVQE